MQALRSFSVKIQCFSRFKDESNVDEADGRVHFAGPETERPEQLYRKVFGRGGPLSQ